MVKTKRKVDQRRSRLIKQILASEPVCGVHLRSFISNKSQVNIVALRSVGVNGFVNDSIRRRAWPLILGLDPDNLSVVDFQSMAFSQEALSLIDT